MSTEAPSAARRAYESGKAARLAEQAVLDARSRLISRVRLSLVFGAIALLGAIVWSKVPAYGWGIEAAIVAVFVVLVFIHPGIDSAKQVAEAGVRYFERGLARLDGSWRTATTTPFERGDAFKMANHPYADDLDLFGPGSVFQRLSQAQTRFGAAELASWLKAAPRDMNVARARQAAVRDLQGRTDFRASLYALGAQLGEEKPDPAPMLEWAEGKLPLEAPGIIVLLARVLPVLTVGALLFSSHLPRGTWIGLLAVQLAATMGVRGRAAKIVEAVGAREGGLRRYGDMLALVEREKFEAPHLQKRRAELAASGTSATEEMASLARVVSYVEARHNEVFKLFIAPFLLWDMQCAFALEKWRARCGKHVRAWLDVLGEVEALASLAVVPFEDEGATYPEIADEPMFVAEGLAHPLIDAAVRIGNDVELAGPGHALIVTGSNMSGKSTLLRAMGANAVLALAGSAVPAKRLRIGPLRVVTSMRIADSLERGVSHFFAEVQRLKLAVDMSSGAREGRPPPFFLLDEILHGTNARERLIGARSVVRSLVERGAMGAVSTHDMAIGDLEREVPGKIKNVHFEEQVVEGKMQFDFKLKPGIVHSSNALRLMKIVGIDVPLDD